MSNNKISNKNLNNLSKLNKSSSSKLKNLFGDTKNKYYQIKPKSIPFSKNEIILKDLDDLDIEYMCKKNSILSIRFDRLRNKVRQIHHKKRNKELIHKEILSMNDYDIFNYDKIEISNPLKFSENLGKMHKTNSNFSENIISKNYPENLTFLKQNKKLSVLNKKRNVILDKIDSILAKDFETDSDFNKKDEGESIEYIPSSEHRSIKKSESSPKILKLDSNTINAHCNPINDNSNYHSSKKENHSSQDFAPFKLVTPRTQNSKKSKIEGNTSYFPNLKKVSINRDKFNLLNKILKSNLSEKNWNKTYENFRSNTESNDRKAITNPNRNSRNNSHEKYQIMNHEQDMRRKFDMIFSNQYFNIIHKLELAKMSNILF